MSNYIKIFLVGILLFGSSLFAYADNGQNGNQTERQQGRMMQVGNGGPQMMNQQNQMGKPMIMGIVTKISGDTITMTSKNINRDDNNSEDTITYTVDASNATFYKAMEKASISDVKDGNRIMVEGTVSDTKITATEIHIGNFSQWENGQTGILNGNGKPVVVGKVTDVNESNKTITIEAYNNASYVIDLSGANIYEARKTIQISDIKDGNIVLVQGEIDGSNVKASNVSVQTNNKSTTGQINNQNGQKVGFFHKIGNFFSHLFSRNNK